MVICGTSHAQFLLKKDDISTFTEPGSIIPTSLIIDLSMPRSVDPQLSKHPHISLFNIEEINGFVDQKHKMDGSEKERMSLVLQKAINAQLVLYHTKCNKVVQWAIV